ncbi:hypothetical protein BC941DRAFT_18229 [Chlamydoabsidia padenii]|nr:hypothetical protein BC941DRAFT_18229 [Chlamydoabsidia padenii]
MPQWNVGLLFTKKKIERSGFIGIEYYARQHDINVILLDISHPIESQGSVDVIVHKMTDVVGKMNRDLLSRSSQCDYIRPMGTC